jgi:ABC-type cobalamin/Fe3+-siderophores transport system ATPase subunit
MIQQLHLKSFKGFRDYKVSLKLFTNLVGLNSRGKTSILQAIEFVHELVSLAIKRNGQLDFDNIQWEFGPQNILSRYSLSDPVALWFDKNTSCPCCVSAQIGDKIFIDAKVTGPSKCQLDLRIDGISKRGQPLGTEERSALQSLLDDNAIYLPPLGATSGLEKLLPYPVFQQHLQEGRHTETWRNSLYWLYNDGDKHRYAEVVELVTRYISESKVLPPRQNHEHASSVVIEFEENSQKYDIGLSGAGLRSLLNLGTTLLLSNSRLILLDEPDSHLHSSLQRVVARMLIDFSAERGVQIITASHAPDFIAETPLDSILWIDRMEEEAKPISTLARILVDLGALSGTDAILVGSANSVLFVEGTTDRRVLSAAFEACGSADPISDSKTILAKLPDGKSSADSVRLLPPLLEGLVGKKIRVTCLVDNDWELLEDDVSNSTSKSVVCLPRKEVENYLIEPAVFARAAAMAAERRQSFTGTLVSSPDVSKVDSTLNEICEEIRESVRWQLIWRHREKRSPHEDPATREQLSTQWFNNCWETPGWKIKAVPGKQVLGKLRHWCQQEYSLTVSNQSLIEALDPVPSDLKRALESIANSLKA